MAISQIGQPPYPPEWEWDRFWERLAKEKGSTVRSLMAKAVLCVIREEIGEYESIAWPSVIVEATAAELTREEVYRALDDLNDLELIGLDANEHGVYVSFVVHKDEAAEWLAFWCAQSAVRQ